MIKIKGWNLLKEDGYAMYYNSNRMECSETHTYKDGVLSKGMTYYAEFKNDTNSIAIAMFENGKVMLVVFDKYGAEISQVSTRFENMVTTNPVTFITSARDLLNNTKP